MTPESPAPQIDGLYVLQVLEHPGGRVTSPAPDRGYLVELVDGWLLLKPYAFHRAVDSWRRGESEGYLLPLSAQGTAENREVLATLTGHTLVIVHKRTKVTARYLRYSPTDGPAAE